MMLMLMLMLTLPILMLPLTDDYRAYSSSTRSRLDHVFSNHTAPDSTTL